MLNHKLKKTVFALLGLTGGVFLFAALTWCFSVRPLPDSLARPGGEVVLADILDRNGYLLSLTRQNRLNPKPASLWQMPDRLIQAFILAEDKRFYRHHGVDWQARAKACWENLRAARIVRGASTITEQSIRILHPRTRTLFNRWVETLEAYRLEKKFSKGEILEFYLNQVPFSHQCRGVQEAALFYFDRDLETLNTQEMLALAVVVRAPGLLGPKAADDTWRAELDKRVSALAGRMKQKGLLPGNELITLTDLKLNRPRFPAEASHFVRQIKDTHAQEYRTSARLITTLDIRLQSKLDLLLRETLKNLKSRQVRHGAILVLDHETGEILAWVNGKNFFDADDASQIDAVLTPRQPGSTLKPFLYAMALEQGYTTASVLADIPLVQPVGHGLHNFRNYSSRYYGPVRLRCALGNSLNVPAVRMVQSLGVASFRQRLLQLGLKNLDLDAGHYGEGLALGNGEISLYELVRAYGVLARAGIYREPKSLLFDERQSEEKRIFPAEVCSLIADILSDPQARALEFSGSGLLDFPVQTAVKTGTSTDYRDAWAIGFNYRYTAGVWMGNLDYQPMNEITGSRGPALVLRSVFHELTREQATRPLYFHRGLRSLKICALSGRLAGPHCPQVVIEWFRPQEGVSEICSWHAKVGNALVTRLPHEYRAWVNREAAVWAGNSFVAAGEEEEKSPVQPLIEKKANGPPVQMIQPVSDLHLALDPRIPDDRERFPLIVKAQQPIDKIQWFLDGRFLSATGAEQDRYLWKPERGRHSVFAKVLLKKEKDFFRTPEILFWVK